jgi:hypothetical protein
MSSELLGRLRPVTDGRFSAQAAPSGCMADTRRDLLQQITDWAKDPHSSQSVFWLTGLAGTGKSAIMRTMCERLADENLLGASFFISRGNEKRRDPQNIVRTLIHDLAEMCPELRGPICDALQKNKFISDDSIGRQLQVLISEPYTQVTPDLDRSVVLVLDGLDECEKDKDTGRQGGELLPLLLRTIAACRPWLKLLIASRQERMIDKMFGFTHRSSLKLQDEEQSTRMDIELYLTDSLHAIAQAYSSDLPHDWPGEGAIRELTDRSSNLFIYADTVVKLFKHPDVFPDEIVASILGRRPKRGTYAQLDAVYKHILESAFSSNPLPERRDALRSHLRDLLGILLVLQAPVSVTELAIFLELETRTMRLVLESISAVVVVPENDIQRTTRLFHTSFTDFLMDSSRCPNLLFKADLRGSHDTLATVSYKLFAGEMMGPREYVDDFWTHHLERASLPAQQIAVETLRRRLVSKPPEHEGRSDVLYYLTRALQECYKHGGGRAYLEEAVSHRREMVKVRSDDDNALGDLAVSLQYLFDLTGEVALLDEVIALNREALELCPPGHPTRDYSLGNLASALLARFKQTGDAALLDEVIALHREALELCPPGHPNRDSSLNNLAEALRTRFEQTGDVALLDEVIGLHREALELRLPGHPTRDYSLSNLADALLTRFRQTGQAALLDEVIALNREALELRPLGHPTRDYSLNNLAYSLLSHYQHYTNAGSLAEAVVLFRQAHHIRVAGHIYYESSLVALADALMEQFDASNDEALLMESVELYRRAVNHTPTGHPEHSLRLYCLADALRKLNKATGAEAALEEAEQLEMKAVELEQQVR